MSIERAKRLLKQKEGIRLEFKEAKTALPANLFESICAMLNRNGGDILLGVKDDGSLIGVDANSVEKVIKDLINLSNNPQKLDPPFILFPQQYTLNQKKIIQIQVPASSLVHKTNQQVYDRSGDGDFKITQPHLIAEIYNNKKSRYTEGIIYPGLKFSDFKKSLFPKIRNLIRSNQAEHPWLSLTNEQLLQTAGFYKTDFKSKEKGYTLAAALLFGKDDVIQSILPHYKIDALLRVKDTVRFDDREYIQTNLIEAYEKLMDFVAKHLPDKFYMIGDQRVSLRTKIFREVVANLIIHREYTNAYPASFIIYNNRVETKNANNPNGSGAINPNNFAPFPKNPSISKFFIQLGRVDELGSGVLNVNRFIKEYSGGISAPDFIEDSTFTIIIPIGNLSDLTPVGTVDGTVVGIPVGTVVGIPDGTVDGRPVGTVVGIPDGTVDGTSDGTVDGTTRKNFALAINKLLKDVTAEVQEKISEVLIVISNDEGKRVPHYKKTTGLNDRSIERYIKLLNEAGLIEFRGDAKKTGGYYVTRKLKRKLKK